MASRVYLEFEKFFEASAPTPFIRNNEVARAGLYMLFPEYTVMRNTSDVMPTEMCDLIQSVTYGGIVLLEKICQVMSHQFLTVECCVCIICAYVEFCKEQMSSLRLRQQYSTNPMNFVYTLSFREMICLTYKRDIDSAVQVMRDLILFKEQAWNDMVSYEDKDERGDFEYQQMRFDLTPDLQRRKATILAKYDRTLFFLERQAINHGNDEFRHILHMMEPMNCVSNVQHIALTMLTCILQHATEKQFLDKITNPEVEQPNEPTVTETTHTPPPSQTLLSAQEIQMSSNTRELRSSLRK